MWQLQPITAQDRPTNQALSGEWFAGGSISPDASLHWDKMQRFDSGSRWTARVIRFCLCCLRGGIHYCY